MEVAVDKIRPCPFCGGNIVIIPITRQFGESPNYYFSCQSCHVESRISLTKELTLKHANSRNIYIVLEADPVAETQEYRPGVNLDYDSDGLLIGIEEIT